MVMHAYISKAARDIIIVVDIVSSNSNEEVWC